MLLNFPHKKKTIVLALGAESAGNFSVFHNGKIYFSKDFGDLLEENNWEKYQKKVLAYLKDNKIKPKIILTDLHPLYKTTTWGKELAKKYNAKHISIQHHFAHIFSAIGDKFISDSCFMLHDSCFGIAMDGTGFGKDEKIWGGEIFEIKIQDTRYKIQKISRIGHLENQVMIGGDLAVREPARMLISILDKVFSDMSLRAKRSNLITTEIGYRLPRSLCSLAMTEYKKNYIYPLVKKYYTKNQFELIYNQLQQNFNCLETSSTGRILDAISLLLGFCGNKRNYKHEPIDLLEKNSTTPYSDLKPKIIISEDKYILDTTHLFNYVIKYLHKKDKHRIAATAQLYIAEGLWKIILACHPELVSGSKKMPKRVRHYSFFISGGIANNKIISDYLVSKGAYASKIIPRGDAGLSFGQIIYYLNLK